MLLGAVVGIPAALLAVAFLVLVHDLEHWLWHDLPHHLDEMSAPWYLVIGLPVAKALAYAVCLGCGFRGGPVFPAIFLGAALATFPVIWFDVSPTQSRCRRRQADQALREPCRRLLAKQVF